ncbi:hypothetical protein FOS14_07430 [Skermania sp. ID1734]|uniref:DUF6802 family protein n=1 Tax=Skermania sp. ID1734 TaxID=2597516 RepID=UPI00117FE138|nr:DUF6802 family protein [Skermania sp. ID1734]TSE00256.1 hypothetical protein FOS14_07430 [Skermania sp. ID1734]
MVTSNEFALPELAALDAHSSLDDLGAVALHNPIQDIDGDGVLDTLTMDSHGGLIVATDLDHDEVVDHVTLLSGSGEFAAWELRGEADGVGHWVQSDHGRLDK